MIDGLFGSTFGTIPDLRVNVDCVNQMSDVARDLARHQEAIARVNANLFVRYPCRELPAGIFWQRTGGRTHRVVIRREPGFVLDYLFLGGG
jgi:hypothetical protein